MTDGEAVGKKNDDVLGNRLFLASCRCPSWRAFRLRGLDDDFVAAGLLDLDVADDEGGTVDVVLLLHPDFLAGERLGVVGTVDLNGDVLAGDALVKLDLEVEAGVRHEAGLIDGIDLGGAGLASGNEGESAAETAAVAVLIFTMNSFNKQWSEGAGPSDGAKSRNSI